MATIYGWLTRDAEQRVQRESDESLGKLPSNPELGAVFPGGGGSHVFINDGFVGSPLLAYYTIRETFSMVQQAPRRLGGYRFKTATGILDIDEQHLGEHWDSIYYKYSIEIRCTELEDGRELRRRVRAGTITPNLGDDWEAEQIPPHPAALRAAYDLGTIIRECWRAFREGMSRQAR
ncbi:MAG: hypothetical protein HYT39_03705 [Candidatus Sungbacteria bacterium]|nr:hypothetical protein [Candidatus Sungbacteria bacterium]